MKRCHVSQATWQAYIDGDEGAFESLYNALVDRLYIYGCNLTDDKSLVKDAIQEIFLKLYQRDRSSLAIQNIRSYLFVALRNHIRKSVSISKNQIRHQQAYQELQPLIEDTEGGLLEGDRADTRLFLEQEIAQLPARQREVIFLKFFEGFDYNEITSIMAISYQVARNYASRGMKRLREQLADQPVSALSA